MTTDINITYIVIKQKNGITWIYELQLKPANNSSVHESLTSVCVCTLCLSEQRPTETDSLLHLSKKQVWTLHFSLQGVAFLSLNITAELMFCIKWKMISVKFDVLSQQLLTT